MKKTILMLFAIALLFNCSFAQEIQMSSSKTDQIALQNAEDMIRKGEILEKYARKQGIFLIQGSLSKLKKSQDKILVEFNWEGAKLVDANAKSDTGDISEGKSVPLDECQKKFEREFIYFFNDKNKKSVRLTDDPDDDAKYKLVFSPMIINYTQRSLMGGGMTIVSLSGFMDIKTSDNDTQLAELFFNRLATWKSTIGKAGMNAKNTIKTWELEADLLDGDLSKIIKKGK